MIQTVGEGGQAAGSGFVFFVIVCAVVAAARYERRSELAKRAKRKAEIRTLLEGRPEDVALFREVLNELDAGNTNKKH